MRSKTSFYNVSLGKNLFRRYWPLWLAYFGILILALPVLVFNLDEDNMYYAFRVTQNILNGGKMVAVYVSFVYSVLVAMCMFSFLYNTRSCGMICSLPVKRETVFLTAYLTGLVPMLLADVLIMLLTALLAIGNPSVTFSLLLQWLAMAVMGNICFYGFAVFCAMLTGSIVILPAVYAVLNLAAFVAEFCAQELTRRLLYGYMQSGSLFTWLSPLMELGTKLWQYSDWANNRVYIAGWGILGTYCAAGLLLSAAALWLFRRRNMETATDTVAIPVLKPLFRTCMAVGTALVFAYVIYDGFFQSTFRNFAAAVFITLLLIAGAIIGWFAAEMLMQKTVRVFRGKWTGCLIVCGVLAVLSIGIKLDVFGIERYVPVPEEIESLYISAGNVQYTDPENIRLLTELHRQIIDHKDQHENTMEPINLYMQYTLKNGRTVYRNYSLDGAYEAREDPDSDVMRLQQLLNVPEAVFFRAFNSPIPMSEETVAYMDFGCYDTNSKAYVFTAEETMDFIENALLPDMDECIMGRVWHVRNAAYYDTYTNWVVNIHLERTVTDEKGETQVENDEVYFHLQMDAERSLTWLKEHTDADIQPVRVTWPSSVPEKYQ